MSINNSAKLLQNDIKNNFLILYDINLIPYLKILDLKKLNSVSKNSNNYLKYHKLRIRNHSANIIKKFFKYSHNIFCDSKKYSNEMLLNFNKSNIFYNKLKFIFVNILYMDEYTIEYANSWIKNTSEYKKSLVEKYISIDHNKKYNKYDLNKLMINMDLSDIFYIGW